MKVWEGKNKHGSVIRVWEWKVSGNIYYKWSVKSFDGSGNRGDWSSSYRGAVEEAKMYISGGYKIRMKRLKEQSNER